MAKKKIFLLSDDLRMHSGIATMSRELVLGTAHEFDWVQLAGAVTHPDKGKIQDMSEATNKLLGRNDCYVKLYPIDGYGDEDTLFAIMNMEKPDVVLHFTDPRFWTWLYLIERQVRSKIPLTYLNIWDDLPYPMYNRPYYESCDVLMSISKQTYNINKQVLGPDRCISIDGMWDKNGNFLPFKTSESPIKQNELENIKVNTLTNGSEIIGCSCEGSYKDKPVINKNIPELTILKDSMPPVLSETFDKLSDELIKKVNE